MALTLRFRLLVLWLLTIAGCGSLGYVIRSVYLLGAEGQTERAVSLARDACSELQAEYGRAAVQTTDDPDDVLMSALLNVVLDDAPGVEGGFWHDALGFVAYAYPTHQGSEPKPDIPSTERGRIEALVRSSLDRVVPHRDVSRSHGRRARGNRQTWRFIGLGT